MPARAGVAAQPAGIPLEPVAHEKMTTRLPPGTGTAAGRRASPASRPAPTARSPAPDKASRVSCSPLRPKSSTWLFASAHASGRAAATQATLPGLIR